jgi:hypothetical protein
MEVRGSVNDRPWGTTLGAIALRRHTGQLTVEADAKRYCIAFEDGAIVAATSPMAADAIARIALTNHFITSTQVPDITRRLAASPDRDEVDVLSETIRFSPDQISKLRHRVVAQRAARTFSLEHGDFVLDDRITLPVVGGVAVDHRHVIYLGVRTNLSEQRLIDDLRQLGSFFVLKPEAVDELSRFGFDANAEPVLEALKVGTSLPELEASHREVDPRTAQAIIYSLVSCMACVIPPRTATQARAPAAGRRITQPIKSPAARTGTREPATSRTTQSDAEVARTTTPVPQEPAARTLTSVAQARTATRPRDPAAARTSTPRDPSVPAGDTHAGPGTLPPFAAGTATFDNQSPSRPATSPPAVARSTTAPYPGSRVTTSPFAPRTSTASPTSYSTTAVPDSGTNTPAATRSRAQSDPGPARTSTPTSTPTAPRTPTRSSAVPAPPPGRTTGSTTAPQPPDPAAPLATARVETDEGVKFVETPTLGGARPQTRAPSPRPAISRAATPIDGFAEQRTPGFGDQRTPADQRTPTDRRFPAEQRTPTDPAFSRTPTGTPTTPTTGRVSTDDAAAAEQAFKRGEAAMKRDQPGDAILEFKAACDLNPLDVDYSGMLAWAKFCAAGDKPGIGVDTRKALERAVFKSHRPERARFYLGRVERMLGRDKEALRHFQEVLDLKPNHAEAASEIRAIESRLAAANKSGGLFGRKR